MNRLYIIERFSKHGNKYVVCNCRCGNQITLLESQFDDIKSCGCNTRAVINGLLEADTRILTKEDKALRIGDAGDREYTIFTGQEWIKTKFLFKTKASEVYKVFFDQGSSILSRDAGWKVFRWGNTKVDEYEVCRTLELGNNVVKGHREVVEGLVQASTPFLKGCLLKAGFFDTSSMKVALPVLRRYHAPFMSRIQPFLDQQDQELYKWIDKKTLPEEIYNWRNEDIYEFISGYFGFEGVKNNKLIIYNERPLLESFQLLFRLVGIRSVVSNARNKETLKTNHSELEHLLDSIDNPRIELRYTNKRTKPVSLHTNFSVKNIELVSGDFNLFTSEIRGPIALSCGVFCIL